MKPDTIIACTQCEVTLYRGQPQEIGAGHGTMKWMPVPKGSYTPPASPPKRCPICGGSTIQQAMRPHG